MSAIGCIVLFIRLPMMVTLLVTGSNMRDGTPGRNSFGDAPKGRNDLPLDYEPFP